MQCLVHQTYENLDIILINDGSTDNSAEICREHSQTDSRIRMFSQKNSGQASARNRGIEEAYGDYILFLDADDLYACDIVEYLYDLLKRTESDISICRYIKFWDEAEIPSGQDTRAEEKVYSPQQAISLLCYQKTFNNSPCKLFKKSIFENIRFPENKGFEDLAIIYQTFGKAKRIVNSNKLLYFYRQHSDSTMYQKFSAKRMDRVYVSLELLKYVEKNFPSIKKAAYHRVFISALQVIREIPLEARYEKDREYIFGIIRKYRNIVLSDTQVRPENKIMALSSYGGAGFLHFLGVIYDRVINRTSKG